MGYYANLILRIVLALTIKLEWSYLVFSPATLFSSYWLLSIFGYGVVADFNVGQLIIGETVLNFVEACSAGVAYYLLALIILLTKGIPVKTRIKMFLYGAMIIFFVNLFRVLLLIYILVEYGKYYFDAVHLFFWDIVASVLVVGIWIFLTRKYKITEIPVYSDLKELWKRSYFK